MSATYQSVMPTARLEAGGKQYELRFSLAAFAAAGMDVFSGIGQANSDAIMRLLHAAIVDRNGLTLEEFSSQVDVMTATAVFVSVLEQTQRRAKELGLVQESEGPTEAAPPIQ
jgi:hypothetical protein